jgi:Protein of unknown function (DUF3311)
MAWGAAHDDVLRAGRSISIIPTTTGLGGRMNGRSKKQRGWSWWYLLLLVQFVAVLWPPFYNTINPTWVGMPFFYWYQLAWIIIGAALTAIVYFTTEE